MARPRYEGGSYKPVYFPRWEYLGGETLTMDGTPQAATIPNGANIFEIRAETAAIYFNINHGNASALSPGFVPTNGGEVVGPLHLFTALTLWGVAADTGIAHIMYFREL